MIKMLKNEKMTINFTKKFFQMAKSMHINKAKIQIGPMIFTVH